MNKTKSANDPNQQSPALPEPPRRCWGWKEIALEIDVSERTAKEYAVRNRDPLPVDFGHRGVWAYATSLRDWVRRQNVPYKVHLDMLRTMHEAAEQQRQQRRQQSAERTSAARAALAGKKKRAA